MIDYENREIYSDVVNNIIEIKVKKECLDFLSYDENNILFHFCNESLLSVMNQNRIQYVKNLDVIKVYYEEILDTLDTLEKHELFDIFEDLELFYFRSIIELHKLDLCSYFWK